MGQNNEGEEKTVVKNLRINPKFKKVIRNTLITLLVGTTIASTAVFAKNLHQNSYEKKESAIITEYGEPSAEYMLIEYLDAAVALEDSNINEYKISDDLINKFSSNSTLGAPESILEKLEVLDLLKNSDSKNLDDQYKLMDIVAYLKVQTPLLNDYIRNQGYNIVFNDLLSAIKEYAGEVYNVEPDKLKIYFRTTTSGVKVKLQYGTQNSISLSNGNIACDMSELDYFSNMKNSDASFSKLRECYLKAMGYSAKIRKKVAEKDLYSKWASNRLKSSSYVSSY